MGINNKSWDEQKHPIKDLKIGEDGSNKSIYISVNVGTYWGCRARDCDAEFLVNEVPRSEDGFCLECREIIFKEIGGVC